MYDPVKDGVDKTVQAVVYTEVDPPESLAGLDFDTAAPVLSEFVEGLLADGVIAPNPVTAAILTNIGEIHSVADMASAAALSPRQLQRTLKATTGFSPHRLHARAVPETLRCLISPIPWRAALA